MHIEPHAPSGFGAIVRGLDIASASANELASVQNALYRSRLVVLKDQTIGPEQFCEIANRFGSPVPYLQKNYHHPEFPLIFVSSNVDRNGEKMGVARTGGYWHSDTAFEAEPKPLTMLLPQIVPKNPRNTLFIDMSRVYRALDTRLLDRLRGKEFAQSGRWRYKIRVEDEGIDITELLAMIDHFAPPARHPAIFDHPVTGEPLIYGSRGFTTEVCGESMDASAEILTQLFDFAEGGEFTEEIAWEVGDLIIWDNRFLMHKSGRPVLPGEQAHALAQNEEPTMMYRITLKDDYPLCGPNH